MRNIKITISEKLTGSIVLVIILEICLLITTFALVNAIVAVENNIFRTAQVKINLNDGKPIIDEHDYLFEPGMSVKKDFFIQNNSSWSVYYKLYLDNVSGGLANTLIITLKDGDTVLYSGTPASLTRKNTKVADEILEVGAKKNLSMYFYYPEEKGNKTQNLSLTFDLSANAVQTKNNPKKMFD